MRNTILTALREAVRGEIAQAFETTGFAKPRHIARLVCATHPDDIQAIGEQLAEDALTKVARDELKKSLQGRDSPLQMCLPGLPETLASQLPPAISIPVGEKDVDDEVIYKPLARATLADVEAHLELLSSQITADVRRHRALKELRDLALAAGATAQSLVLTVLTSMLETEVEVA